MPFLPRSPARRRRLLALTATVLVLGAAIAYLTVALERRREVEALETIRDSLSTLRVAVDSCRTELARKEVEFRRFAARVDSLRERVGAFESLDPEGVPEEEYPDYLAAFDRYNEAVPGWRARADSLRSHEAACRALVESHNLLADSLRVRFEAWRAEDPG